MLTKIKNKQIEVISDFDINNNRLTNVDAPIDILDATNKNYVDTISLNAALGTGLYTGGFFTIVDNTHFNISSGVGFIVDPITKNIEKITWGDFSNVSVMSYGETDITISLGIALDVNNNPYVYQQVPKFTSLQRREIIILGELFIHPTNHTLYDNLYMPIWSRDLPSIIDIHINQGPISIEGNSISSNGSNLYLDASSGKSVGYSINCKTDIEVPNESIQPSITHIHFYSAAFYNNGTTAEWEYFGDTLTYDNIDPEHWSDGINWSNNQFTLRNSTPSKYNIRILCRGVLLGRTFFMVYPTQPNEYQNIIDAESALFSLGINIPPEITSLVVPLCYIIIRGNATDLSDPAQCKFITIQSISSAAGSLSALASNISYTGNSAINLNGISNVEDALTAINNKIENLDYVVENLDMSANTGSGIYLATNTAVYRQPTTSIRVEINGIPVDVGSSITNADCFFSGDGGITARDIRSVQQGDYLYWNENTSTYALENDDKISFIYMFLTTDYISELNMTYGPVFDLLKNI